MTKYAERVGLKIALSDKADFSGITKNRNLKISHIFQQTSLKVKGYFNSYNVANYSTSNNTNLIYMAKIQGSVSDFELKLFKQIPIFILYSTKAYLRPVLRNSVIMINQLEL